MTAPVPAWGLKYVVPDNAIAAWGARTIVTQQGDVDFLPDRQGTDGGPHSTDLIDKLAHYFPIDVLKDTIGMLLRGFRVPGDNGRLEKIQMHTREAEDFILYMDDRLVIHANTNASAGYCYVTAWMYPES